MLRVVLYSLAQDPLRLIRVAEVRVRPALPRPVAHLLCDRQVLRLVLYSSISGTSSSLNSGHPSGNIHCLPSGLLLALGPIAAPTVAHTRAIHHQHLVRMSPTRPVLCARPWCRE
jgi:hypothetical protein